MLTTPVFTGVFNADSIEKGDSCSPDLAYECFAIMLQLFELVIVHKIVYTLRLPLGTHKARPAQDGEVMQGYGLLEAQLLVKGRYVDACRCNILSI